MTDWTPPGPGPWMQDVAHLPDPVSGCMAALFPTGFRRGFAEGFGRYGLLLDRMEISIVNGFSYLQPQPFDMPGPDGPPTEEHLHNEIGRRTGVAAAALESKLWREDLDLWDRECKPASVARHRELGDVDLVALDDDALISHLRAVVENVTAMVYQHHRFNISAIFPVGDFALHASGWTGRPPDTLFGVLDGHSSVSGVVSDEMAEAVEAIRSNDEAHALVSDEGDAGKRLGALRTLSSAVDDYCRSTDFRLTDGFDIANPTLRERPELTLGKLGAALGADSNEARTRADQFAATLRAEVPTEHQAEFDELLAEARLMYRLRDERGVFSDISAIGLLRLVMMEIGRRAHSAGRLHAAEHVVDAEVEEAEALLLGAGPSADELAERVKKRGELATTGAPHGLGPPPPEPPPVDQLPPPLARVMGGVGFVIEGILGQMEEPAGDDSVIVGIPAASGVYEGPARLVHNIDDLLTLTAGDVLVAPTTGEAFNSMLHLVSAIVTNHGSYASHAGIVAREMGFPAVVGTVNATARIKTGDRVRVDGASGEVTIVG